MTDSRIALVTTWFPPETGVAVNRMNAFANYLSKDFEVEVFTIGKDNSVYEAHFGLVHHISSTSMLDHIKHKSSDKRFKHNLKTVLNVISSKLNFSSLSSWKKDAARRLNQRHMEKPFDVIISSYAPSEPHDVAYMLKRNNPKLIWIADMRDEMGSNPFISTSVKNKLRKKEINYQDYIDAITTVSNPILEDFKKVFPKVKYVEEIRNGFDHDIQPSRNFNIDFTIAYAGTFYGKRKPDNFFEAIQRCINNGTITDNLKILFIGTNKNFTIPNDLKDYVEFVQKIEYTKAIELISKVDCNLLINPPLGTKGQFSGKIFDYISVQKPILGIVDKDDVAAELIREHNAGIVADFDNIDEIVQGLLAIYDHWKKKEPFPIRTHKTLELHRRNQVLKLKELILKLLKK